MGNAQSQSPAQGHGQQNRRRANGVYDGPLFGGHYAGDFSLARQAPVHYNKSLPDAPRNVHFGHAPPAWEFHRDSPTWDNTANTRYCSPPQSNASPQQGTPPSVNYSTQDPSQGMRVMNQ